VPPTAALDDQIAARIRRRLEKLYGEAAEDCLREIINAVERFRQQAVRLPQPHDWDQRDVVLITYADQLRPTNRIPHATGVPGEGLPEDHPEQSPLATLEGFLRDEGWDQLLSTVHLLPFFPYSSDDGFSVIDYLAVDPRAGNWDDIGRLGNHFRLMFDLVLNHISCQSAWFQSYLDGQEPYARFFIEVAPETDLSEVTRPRSLPLLTPVETSAGTRHVWSTFSSDQIDLDYRQPQVLVAMLEVLLAYVARGAQIVRLDAIAYLWKEIGTPCVHLPRTHEVVKLMRNLLEEVAPGVWLLTETNVPHQENIRYFGQGDEARLVYQFSLPPLLLDAFVHHDAKALMQWLAHLEPSPPGTTYFNFTASHDGIGVRPLEGLVAAERIASLVDAVRHRGGLVSTRRQADGTDVPYELNISYLDALAPKQPKTHARPNTHVRADARGQHEAPGQPDQPDADRSTDQWPSDPRIAWHARRFLATQAVMLALRGIPAVYFHSLVGSRNDTAGAESSGQPRRINRQKFSLEQLQAQIGQPDSLARAIYHGYRRLLEVRRQTGAFHPEGQQEAIDSGNPALVTFLRRSPDGSQTVLVAANVSNREQPLDLATCCQQPLQVDLIVGQPVAHDSGILRLLPGQAVWLE
jgi:sucrose phosphorylase